MRVKIRKAFWGWNFDKEEKWLNEMSAKGLHLVSVGFCTYVFEEGVPGEYTIRLELHDKWSSSPETQQYIRFLEETGAEYIGNVTSWIYFRKKTSEGSFTLYSDLDSRIKHLNRILVLALLGALVNLMNGINNVCISFTNESTFNLVVGILCLTVGVLLLIGSLNLLLKRRKLKKERVLHE